MEPNNRRPPPSGDRPDAVRVPEPEPSDPDAALYAAARARPHWTTKPAVRALIQELSQGLGPGEDLFFWDVHKRRAPRPSDAKEHALILVPTTSAPAARPGRVEELRVSVAPGAEHDLGRTRSDGDRAAHLETTLVSPGGRRPNGRTPEGRGEHARPGLLALLVVGVLVLAGVVLGARLAAPLDRPLTAPAPALSPLDAAPPVASPSAWSLPSSSSLASPRPRPPTPSTRPDF